MNLTNLNKGQSLHENDSRTNSSDSNFFEREATRSLGSLNRKCSWHVVTISMLFVLNIFIKNPFTTKSSELLLFSYASWAEIIVCIWHNLTLIIVVIEAKAPRTVQESAGAVTVNCFQGKGWK